MISLRVDLVMWCKNGVGFLTRTLGKTLDNTTYKASILRELGGFPKMSKNTGIETVLAYQLRQHGYIWAVDYTVKSDHLRDSLVQELKHVRWYATVHRDFDQLLKDFGERAPTTKPQAIKRLLYSPGVALRMAFRVREPRIIYIHPLMRLFYLLGILTG